MTQIKNLIKLKFGNVELERDTILSVDIKWVLDNLEQLQNESANQIIKQQKVIIIQSLNKGGAIDAEEPVQKVEDTESLE